MIDIGNRISLHDETLDGFCRRWKIAELSVFGSVLREDFRADSDIDLLASFHPDTRHSIFDVIRMEEELGGMLGRKVDLIEKRAIERSDNFLRRRAILDSARVIYHVG